MGIALLGLGYFVYIIVKKLCNKVFVTPIIYQYIFLAFLLYVASIERFDSLIVILGGGFLFLLITKAIRSIYRSRYLVANSSYDEVNKIIKSFNLTYDNEIYSFENGNEFRIRRNFEGVLIDFFQFSEENKVNRENLFKAIKNSKTVRSKSWYVDMALSCTICLFIVIFLVSR